MPPSKIKPSDAKSSNLHYVTINDFRPGIYSNVRTNAPGGIIDAERPGMAREGTIGCITNPTGQLVPLPGGTPHVVTFPIDDGFFPLDPVTPLATSVGLTAVGPTTDGTNLGDNIFVFTNHRSLSAGHNYDVYHATAIKGLTPVVVDIFQGEDVTGRPGISRRGVSSIFTRGKRSGFTFPGYPILCWEYASGDSHFDSRPARYVVYPDPNALNTDTAYREDYTIDTGSHVVSGQLVAHSGRIIRLCENNYPFGAGGRFILSNELIRFTDPPGNIILNTPTTDSVMDPEIPGGFGAWGSLSFGELLLIKRVGGALMVEGDIYAPQVTRLPGVADVGDLANVASSCPIGLIYCCQDDGAYVWVGGSTSQKISNINDRFHSLPVAMSYGLKTFSEVWNNWVVFANGWMFDTVTESWWQLDKSQALPGEDGIQWAAAGKGQPRYLWVVPGDLTHYGDHDTVTVGRYDTLAPSPTYTWKSQPLPVSYGHTLDIREICLTLSNLTGTTTVSVSFQTLTGQDTAIYPGAETFTISSPTSGPIRFRKPVGVIGESVMLTVQATSTSVAPTLNCIEIGYLPAVPFSPSTP